MSEYDALKPPVLPDSLLIVMGEYGSARTDSISEASRTERWLLLIDAIKSYAAEHAAAALAAQPINPSQAYSKAIDGEVDDAMVDRALNEWKRLYGHQIDKIRMRAALTVALSTHHANKGEGDEG